MDRSRNRRARIAEGIVTDTSHLPPQALESEEAILGAMIASNTAIEIALELQLAERDFYRPSHQTIFRTILDLAEHEAVDELTVVNELKRIGKLKDVGGSAAIMSLYERTPSVANARAYAQDVIDHGVYRRAVETGHTIASLGYEKPYKPLELVSEAGRLTDVLASDGARHESMWTTLGDELEPMLTQLQEMRERGDTIVGISTGLEVLDKRWGGLQNGRLYICAGRPGMGKSAWLSGVAEHVAIEAAAHVALFNFEMSAEQQSKRAAARLGAADLYRITSGRPEPSDLESIRSTINRLQQATRRLHIDRSPRLTVTQITQRARQLHRRLKRDTGTGLKLVGVDYLQLIETAGRSDNRSNDLGVVSRGLKSLAMELEVPVIALSQLNRSVENRNPPRPMLSDLRESGSIEQDGDVVLLLFRPEYYMKAETPLEWQGKAEAITAKWRDGVPGTDIVGWDGPRTKFVHARDARRTEFVVGGTREDVVS